MKKALGQCMAHTNSYLMHKGSSAADVYASFEVMSVVRQVHSFHCLSINFFFFFLISIRFWRSCGVKMTGFEVSFQEFTSTTGT